MCHKREEIEKGEVEKKNNDGGVNTRQLWVGEEGVLGWGGVGGTF